MGLRGEGGGCESCNDLRLVRVGRDVLTPFFGLLPTPFKGL